MRGLSTGYVYWALSLLMEHVAADCTAQALAFPIRSTLLNNSALARGIPVQIGGPDVQTITLFPSAYVPSNYFLHDLLTDLERTMRPTFTDHPDYVKRTLPVTNASRIEAASTTARDHRASRQAHQKASDPLTTRLRTGRETTWSCKTQRTSKSNSHNTS